MKAKPGLRVGLLLAFLAGLAVRLYGLGWDGWAHQHPDERFLTLVADSIRIPPPGSFLDTAHSPANPHNAGHPFFAYGTLPLFLFRALAELLGRASYEGLLPLQRVVSATADALTVLLLALLARRLAPPGFRNAAALAGGLLYAFLPSAVQQARFGTVDAIGTAFLVGATLAAAGRPSAGRALGAGALLGAAAACKLNLVFGAAVLALFLARERLPGQRPGRRIGEAVARLSVLALSSALVFRLAQPYAFSGPGFFGLEPNPKWLANLAELRSLLTNSSWYPPGIQWVDRPPVLSFFGNLLIWGTGPVLGLFAAAASVALLARALLRRDRGARRLVPVLAVVVPLLLWQSVQQVASVRHAHAALALLVAASAAALPLLLGRRARAAAAIAVGATALSCAMLLSIYAGEHTRVSASRYLANEFPRGARIAFEYWDDPLPLALPGIETRSFLFLALPVFEPDGPGKASRILAFLERADAVVLSSRRGIATLSRVPDAYPWMAEFYRLLASGALGFEKAAVFARRPGIGPISLDDRGAEETFSVYDHPVVTVYRRTPAFSRPLAESLLSRVVFPPLLPAPARVEARGTPPDESPELLAKDRPSPAPPPRGGLLSGVVATLRWVLFLELLGALGAVLLGPLAARLPGLAAGLARPLGWCAAGLAWLWAGHLVPGFQLLPPYIFWAALALVAATGRGRAAWRTISGRSRLVFLSLLAGFLLVRAFNPEVFWGEKPMDAALLNAAVRAPGLPLPEPWFAGAPLDYYAQGFLPCALTARASGAWPGLAYNLAAATLPALLGGLLFAAGSLLSASLLGGAACLVLGLLSGTLAPLLNAGFRGDPFGFAGFWAASRLTPDGINEFPLFTALFADLHAHLHAWAPFGALLILALARILGRPDAGSPDDRRGALLLGLLAAAVHLTNPWDSPISALLLLVALPPRRPSGKDAAWRRVTPFLLAGGAALLAALPALLTVRTAPVAVSLGMPGPLPLLSWSELHGVPIGILALAFVVNGSRVPRGPRVAFLAGMLGLGLLLASEVVTVSDRMNTVFKMGLSARILLAVGAGAAVPGLLASARGRGPVLKGALWLAGALASVAVLSGAAHVAAVLRTQRVSGPRPTLDGFAYVSRYDPAGAVRMDALNELGGLPVVFDPPGEPYSPSLQTTMRTGCPTLVGWSWHLTQRRRSPAGIALREADVARIQKGPRDEVWQRLVTSYGLEPGDVPAGPAGSP